MLARDWYYNERSRIGLDSAVASIYDRHDDSDLRARAALKRLGVQKGWRVADIGCGNGVLATEAALMGAEVDAIAAASMISGYRHNNGLGEVVVDTDLMRMAMEQARGMAARDKLDRAAGREFNTRVASLGFDARGAVENVSAGYHTLAEAFSGWRDSPPHRANMLANGVNRLGIAAVYAPQSKYKVFWALILAAKSDSKA